MYAYSCSVCVQKHRSGQTSLPFAVDISGHLDPIGRFGFNLATAAIFDMGTQGVLRIIQSQVGGGGSAEGERTKGKESLGLLEAPVRKTILQMHTPARTSQCWSRQTPHGLGVCIWMHLVNGTGNSPPLGQPTPGVVKQDKSSRGSVE